MDNSVIAVQVADGSFVPVLDTATQKRRRLVVTTVRDNQTDVRIGLYRGSDESMLDAEYIGSLVISDISAGPAQQADITVLTGVDGAGNLNVTASDTQSGQYESLSVSLEELASGGEASLGDFEIAASGDDDLEDLSLDDLSLDETGEEALDEVSLDDLELDIEESEPASREEDDDLSLDDLSLDDAEELSLEETTETTESAESAAADEDDLSLDDLSLDDADELSLEEATETTDATESAAADEDEISLEDISFDDAEELSLEETTETTESTESAAADEHEISLEDISFDDAEELSLEETTETTESTADSLDDLSLDDISFDDDGAGETDVEDALASFSDNSVALDESLSLEENESLEDTPFGDESLEQGMEQADLGEEDFTFDESEDDEPLFQDGPDDELAALGASQAALDDTLSAEEFDQLDAHPQEEHEVEESDEDQPLVPRRSNALIYAGYIILALAAVGVLTYLIFRLLEGPPAPPLRASYLPNLALFGFFRLGKGKRRHRSR